jgi:hypothetical protein
MVSIQHHSQPSPRLRETMLTGQRNQEQEGEVDVDDEIESYQGYHGRFLHADDALAVLHPRNTAARG